jgi:peptide/nickel transport system ATP-binding protein/glutathione transport system ATP-binding protein
MSALLSVENLHVGFGRDPRANEVVRGISFSLAAAQTLAIVGESGSGKSVTALSINRLVDYGGGRITAGNISLQLGDGSAVDVVNAAERDMVDIRGRDIGMIFQEPMTSLNPVHTVGAQIEEAFRLSRGLGGRAAREAARQALERVRIPDAASRLKYYPHQLSGGMRQRVMIAMALCCGPSLLIADEPTTALDVTTESQILDLLRELQRELGMAMLFITHDLAVASEVADEIAVMYLGYVVERGAAADVLGQPSHPYTRALLDSIPKLGETAGGRLNAIRGMVPTPDEMPPGCPFHTRCREFMPGLCDRRLPELYVAGEGHESRCFLIDPELERLRA